MVIPFHKERNIGVVLVVVSLGRLDGNRRCHSVFTFLGPVLLLFKGL